MINTYNDVLAPVWKIEDAIGNTDDTANVSVTTPATPYSGTVTISDNIAGPFGPAGPWTLTNTALTSSGSSKIKLTGENPDIEIGEHSLMEILEGIRRQLALIKLHPDLEEEFEELRRIGDKYRAKEKELYEKRKVWEKLKR